SNVVNASCAVYAANLGKPKQYWLHTLVLVLFTGFGGGIITPVLLGRPSAPLANDTAIPVCLLLWYAVHYLGCYPIFQMTPVKLAWNWLMGVFRTFTAVKMVSLACTVLTPGPFYPTPLFGPILAGTLASCGGAFLPFDKGLSAITKSTPWVMQGAFLNALFYYLMVKDTEGFLGQTARACLGSPSEGTVILLLSTMNIASLSLQLLFDPSANLFTPFHKVAYLIFQVQGPITLPEDNARMQAKPDVGWAYPVRVTFESFCDNTRIAIVSLFVLWLLSTRLPPVSLPAVSVVDMGSPAGYVTLKAVTMSGMAVGRAVGTCQWTSLMGVLGGAGAPGDCAYAMVLEEYSQCKGACPAGGAVGAVGALDSGAAEKASLRLAVYPHTVDSSTPSFLHPGVYLEKDMGTKGLRWSSSLLDAKTSKALGPQYTASSTYLFLTPHELYLLADVKSEGSVLAPGLLGGRVLWSGKAGCAAGGEAVKLFLEEGLPRVLCSDGASVPLQVGKPVVGPAKVAAPKAASKGKSEL
ncbi:hypothetical protein B484DRAFT_458599, partial [Ochromonadaceae sp. CCMP2298]